VRRRFAKVARDHGTGYAGQRIFVVRREAYVLLGAVRGERAHGLPEDDHPESKATKEYLGEESRED
jgi:hypothetical protein